MGKSIRSKIKKYHRSIKRREEGPVERQKRALQAVALGALPVEKAPGAALLRNSMSVVFWLRILLFLIRTSRCLRTAGPVKVPNQKSSGPERFTFNVHLSKPPEPVVPANLRPKVDGITVGKPNGNPRRYKSKEKPAEMDVAKKTTGASWRSVLRQRIKKKRRSRKARGWGEVPAVLGAVDA